MNTKYYTSERNVQIVISLLKQYGIKKVIASPGTTNFTFLGSIMQDPYFEIYSSVDERSAAYIACGMSAECGEPVALTCTGATASRNYYSGLTEAYYRKLPILAITATQDPSRIGHNIAQVIDRRVVANDIVVASEHIQFIAKPSDEFDVTIKVNRALNSLTKNGGGPVHLNLETTYSRDFSIEKLPTARKINYYGYSDVLPILQDGLKVGVFIGNHKPMSPELHKAIECFCNTYNAAVFCDHTSNFQGAHRVSNSLVGIQDNYHSELCVLDLLIHIGDVSGSYDLQAAFTTHKEWRVCEDGKTCDSFGHLESVFAISELMFFNHYGNEDSLPNNLFAQACRDEYNQILSQLGELPFSNAWLAQNTIGKIPEGAVLHLGILNTLRCWSYFNAPEHISGFSNTGGFGIDGDISSAIGAAIASPEKLFLLVIGDLAFFYDLNSLANKHVPNNIRILLVNNGKGVEFRSPYHPCNMWGEDADMYMAAGGHFGNKSHSLIRHFAEDLGYEYYPASNKEEYEVASLKFLSPTMGDKPIILEAFVDTKDEQESLRIIHTIVTDKGLYLKEQLKQITKKIMPQSVIKAARKIIN